MTLSQKLNFLLSHSQKRQLMILAGLLLIGTLLEMAGLGIIIPALGLMLNSDIGKEYPALQPYLKVLGSPTQIQLIMWGMSTLVLVYILKAGFLMFLSWRQSKFSAELCANLGKDLFLGYLRQPYAFHLQRNSAQLLSNIQTEIVQFSSVSQAAVSLTLEFSVVVGISFMLIIVEPLGALVVTSFLAISAFGFHRLTRNKLMNWGERRQFHAAYSNQHLLQGLGGVKDVKLLNREEYFLKEYNLHNQEFAKIQTRVISLSLIPRLYLELLAVIGLASLIVLMVVQSKPLDLLLPTLGVFVAAAFRMMPSVNRIMGSIQQIRYAQPVIEVLYQEFSMIRKHAESTRPPVVKVKFSNEISIKDLCFNYSNVTSRALDGISIKIKIGESVGFIGPSGSGKSTLVDVILGLLTPGSGTITIDGQEIQKDPRGWQCQIGYVPQSIYLTDDSLRRNIAFGIADNLIDELAVERALKAAQLDGFVAKLPMGLETTVGERGVRLSGGQRQRIGIARALYHDPIVLVLDEATSALDSDTEREVMQAVAALKGDKTLLIVAHRLSTVQNCNRLYRLENGKIDGEGTPKTILKINQIV